MRTRFIYICSPGSIWRRCGAIWDRWRCGAAVVVQVWIVVPLIYAELFKKIVFEAVRPRGSLCFIRPAVIGSDRVQSYLQNVLLTRAQYDEICNRLDAVKKQQGQGGNSNV